LHCETVPQKNGGKTKRKVVAVITDALGDRVVVGENELDHAISGHFSILPQDIILELLERILKDPTVIYQDDRKKERVFNFFYRLEKGPRFIVAVIKVTPEGAYFASMYPTGSQPRNTHKNYKRVK
jgi:hypothetical protein